MKLSSKPKSMQSHGFTIVELLVVIVVIGILAAITIVSYTGINQKAITASLQSDLTNASQQLKMFQVDNNNYPASVSTDCSASPDTTTNKCLRASPGTIYNYTVNNAVNPQTFGLNATNGSASYDITNDTAPALTIPTPTVTIGTQVWMQNNINDGNRVNTSVSQIVGQKWCYSDLESNCTTYGGLYQWNTAMVGSATEGTKGICPNNFHIPSDGEYKTLEVYLGMTQVQADATGWRGTDQGTKLKSGGASGFNVLLGGYYVGALGGLGVSSIFWSSTQYDATHSYGRDIDTSRATVYRDATFKLKTYGHSVRCIKN